MATKGLKIWMVHWQIANEFGKLEYTCPMIEVMKRMSEDGDRPFLAQKKRKGIGQ